MKQFSTIPCLIGMAILSALPACREKAAPTFALEEVFPDGGNRSLIDQAQQAIDDEDYPKAALLLQQARALPNLNAEQLTAVQDAMADFQLHCVARAEDGDARAQQALELLRMTSR